MRARRAGIDLCQLLIGRDPEDSEAWVEVEEEVPPGGSPPRVLTLHPPRRGVPNPGGDPNRA